MGLFRHCCFTFLLFTLFRTEERSVSSHPLHGDIVTHAFFSALAAFLASFSSILTRAASSCTPNFQLSPIKLSLGHALTSSGVIFDFCTGDMLLLEEPTVLAVPSLLFRLISICGES